LYKGHVLFVLMTIPPPIWLTTRVARRVTAVEHGLHTFSLHLSHCILVPCCRVRHHFRVKQCSVRLCSNWFCKDSMVYLCYLCLHTYTSVKHDLHIRWCSCRLTVRRRVTLVEQRLPIPRSTWVHHRFFFSFYRVRGSQSLVFCVLFFISLFVFLSLFFCAFVLFALLWFATSYCPFDIAKLSFFPAETTIYFFMKVRNVLYNIYSYWGSGMCIILF
jgi:hypothetical protein